MSVVTDVMKRGVDIIDALLDFYNRSIIEEKNRSAVQTEAFILDRLVMISGELKDVENRLQAYRQTHNITDIQAQSNLNLSLQSSYEQQMAEVEADMNIYDEIERIVSSSDSYETLPAAVKQQTLSPASSRPTTASWPRKPPPTPISSTFSTLRPPTVPW